MTDEVFALVYKTSDYTRFKKLQNNRRVSAERVATIKSSLKEKEVINPIIVNNKFEIIEGQGRYEAKKQLGLPIYYIIDPSANEEDCIRLNKNNRPWGIYDYMYSYADSGIQSYITLSKLYEETGLPVARILRFANRGTKRKDGDEVIRSGELKFTESDCAVVRAVKEKCDEIVSALQMTRKPNETFCTAVKVVVDTEGYNHVRMLRRCAKYKNSFTAVTDLEDMLKEFTRIYNKDSGQKAERIYFEDYMRNRGKNVRGYSEGSGANFEKYDVNDNVSTLMGV